MMIIRKNIYIHTHTHTYEILCSVVDICTYVSEELPANAIKVSPLSDYSNTSEDSYFLYCVFMR